MRTIAVLLAVVSAVSAQESLPLRVAAGVSCCSSSTGGGGGNSTRYYVSANGCDGGNAVSYSVYDYTTCNFYYRSAVTLRCTKIYDNCRAGKSAKNVG